MKNRIFSSLFLPLFLTSLTLLTQSSAFAQIPSSGLVGYWPFNGNANDESGNGNNGTVNGATLTTDRFGNANSAYSFNGNTIDVNSGNQFAITQSSQFTVNFWYYTNSQASPVHFLGKRSTTVANLNWQFAYNMGSGQGLVFNGALGGCSTGSQITLGQWEMLTGVFNNGTWSIYRNGNFINSTSANVQSDLGNLLKIGNAGSADPFYGKLDDISIYNRALTPAEITQLYTDQTSTVSAPPCPTLATNLQTGLVGYWPFCGNANDESGNGNNGTVNGATLTADRFGNANSAYSFDGVNDIITLNAIPMQNGTISLWYEESVLNNSNPNNGHPPIGSQLIGQGTGHQPSITYCDFALGISSYNGGPEYYSFENSAVNSWTDYSLGTVGNNSVWNNIVIVIDGTQLSMYLNGSLFSSTTLSNALLNSGAPLSFGGRYVFQSSNGIYYHNFFKGNLDDICIWTRSLTPTEITQLYTDPSTTPVACTPFLGEDQTVCAGTSVILEAGQSSYSIGQTGPAGGIVFHTQQNANGETQVFEAAPSDIGNVMWGCAGFFMNQTSAAIGSGQQNTNAIISACGNSTAAALCANYTLNGADDWYLPSINELTLMFQNLWANGMGNFNAPNGQYWSSTENSSAGSMIVSIEGALPPNYAVTEDNKSFTDYIRPCRSFTVANNTYLWSTGATTATINVTPTTTTTYTCTVTDANGNVCTDSVTVFVPQIEATDLTICTGETTTLSVSGINSTATPSACPTLPTNLQTGLVGYWPFCGNANDVSGNGNNGTVNGATLTTDRFGNSNSAYSFDGNSDFIQTNTISALNSNQNTISMWVNTSVYSVHHQLEYAGVSFGSLGRAFAFNTARLAIVPHNDCVNASSPGVQLLNGQFSQGTWCNLTFVSSGTVGKFYINGILIGEQTIGSTICNNPLTLVIGRGTNGGGPMWYTGKFDEISIYNRVLTASEIQQLYTLGQTTYLWSNGATTPTINVSPTSTTTYTCTVTTNGVSCADSVTVVVSQPVASITPNGMVEICEGESIALTANGGVSYLWNTGAPTQSITVNTEAVYTVTVTDENGCTDTESQLVKVNFLPNIGVNNASICSGQSTTLTATGGLSYEWSPATGLSSTTGTTVTASPSTSTVYTVTGTGANGCTNTATATVAVNDLPVATITPATATTFCQGGGVVLNANTGAGLSYQWFNNTVAISGETSSTYIANTSGSYTVIVTSTTTCSSTSNSIDVTTVANVNYFADADGDGFGDAATLVSTCIQPQGYVTDNTDCDDNDSNVNTAATEVCNHIDDDCSGTIDDGLVFETYYADNDGDTYGDANNSIYECSQPSGYVTNNTDCNDNDANQNAASSEICNGEDDDCDGAIDNGITFLDYYADADGDGFGAGDVISSCSDLGAGYVSNNTDCDDTNSGVYPGAEELCNSIDDNCDGQTDDGTLTVYFIDNDGDTYGNPSVSILACVQPIGYTPDDNDCNDTDANINPGAEDIGGNGIDENCDGQIDNSIYELNSTIALYPNPTSAELNIQVNSSVIGSDLYIFDAVGKLVRKQQLLSTQTAIPVSNFADGNYVVRVGEVVKRFVVEK